MPSGDFFERNEAKLCSPINMAPRPLSKPPVVFSLGDEVPHIFIRESHQRPRKILISGGKRLFQQHRSNPDFLLGGSTSASAECRHGPREQSVGQPATFCLAPSTSCRRHMRTSNIAAELLVIDQRICCSSGFEKKSGPPKSEKRFIVGACDRAECASPCQP